MYVPRQRYLKSFSREICDKKKGENFKFSTPQRVKLKSPALSGRFGRPSDTNAFCMSHMHLMRLALSYDLSILVHFPFQG